MIPSLRSYVVFFFSIFKKHKCHLSSINSLSISFVSFFISCLIIHQRTQFRLYYIMVLILKFIKYFRLLNMNFNYSKIKMDKIIIKRSKFEFSNEIIF